MHPFPHHYTVEAAARPAGTDTERATKLLEKSERVCLVSNSLAGRRRLNPTVVVD